jgi:hypothetical protein
MTSSRRRRLWGVVALGLLASACGQPGENIPIGMREYVGDVVYGDQSPPTTLAAAPAANPVPGFPGFVSPPAPRPAVLETFDDPLTTTTTSPPPACPAADPLAVPRDVAGTQVSAPPEQGVYTYRQGGTVLVGNNGGFLPASSDHRVANVQSLLEGVFRFDVAISEFGAETTTTYQVDQRGADDGVFIAGIRTGDSSGVDQYRPTTPVKILPLPPVVGRTFSSAGTDPLNRTTIVINGRVIGKTRVDACGDPLDAWLVEIGNNPSTGQPSRIIGPNRNIVITGTLAIAPQFGGLIVEEKLKEEGSDSGQPVLIDRTATINSTSPRPLPQ